MPLIRSFYMNFPMVFGKFCPNLMVIHNINRSKWLDLKSSTTPRLKSSKAKFQLEILLSKLANYRRRKCRVLAIFPVTLCQCFWFLDWPLQHLESWYQVSHKLLLSPLYKFWKFSWVCMDNLNILSFMVSWFFALLVTKLFWACCSWDWF